MTGVVEWVAVVVDQPVLSLRHRDRHSHLFKPLEWCLPNVVT